MSNRLPFEHNGQTHYVYALTDQIRESFVAWSKASAIRETLATRHLYPQQEFRKVMSELNADIAIRKLFEWGEQRWQDVLPSEAGARQWARLVMLNEPSLTDEQIDELMTVQGDAINEMFKALNPPPPEATTEGKA